MQKSPFSPEKNDTKYLNNTKNMTFTSTENKVNYLTVVLKMIQKIQIKMKLLCGTVL